jgi:rod shape-determining protein MreC
MYPPLLRSVLVLGLISIALMIVDRSTDWLQPLRFGTQYLGKPFYWALEVPKRIERWGANTFASKTDLIKENHSLRQERLIFSGRLQRMSELAAENLRLLQLLNASKSVMESVILTQVIGNSHVPQRHTITIDRGATDGSFIGQPVIDAGGLMGQVITVYDTHSEVLLISDASHALPVKVLRNGVRSIAEGTSDFNRLTLRFVPPTSDIELGDQLVSSGLGGRFPAGYPVGQISSIEKTTESEFMSIEVEPFALLNRSTHLLLVFSSGSLEPIGVE